MFVPYYKYDIVISYAHVDNEPAVGVENGWVSTLAEGLKNRLAQKLGRREDFSLWMDYRLSLHEPWTPEIMDALEHAAILVVILSPGYLASQWCQRERSAFLKMVRARPRSSARIFIVERDKIEESERPAEFRELAGYRFWIVEREGKPPRILGDPKPNPDDPKCLPYYDQLNDLSNGLAEELKRLRSLVNKTCIEGSDIKRPALKGPGIESAGIESAGIESAGIESLGIESLGIESAGIESTCIEGPGIESAGIESAGIESAGIESTCIEGPDIESRKSDERPAVFLAEVTDDLIVYRDAVKRYLDQGGIRVLQPEIFLYFSEPDTFQQAVDKDLGNSKIFVQLLSNLDGKRLPGRPSYIHLQYERALKAGKPVLQWRDPSLNLDTVTDEDHRRLVEGETVWAVGLEEFKRTVVNRALIKPAVRIKDAHTLVFLDVSPEDSPLADEIVSVMKKYHIGYARPLQHGKPSDIREELDELLLESDGIIIVYGAVTPVWARRQLLYCRKIIYKREQPPKAIAVYEGPPEEKDPLDFALPDMQTIDCRRCLIEEKLLPFFESLEAEGCA